MSELKADNTFVFGEECLAYKKSEADKVIAEKDAEIAQLQAMLEERNKQVGELKKESGWLAKDRAQAYDDLEKRAQLNIKQEESIRHHKYKRCLAMAERCETNVYNIRRKPLCDMDDHEGWQHDDEFWQRWHKRWLELAEKFKEVK